MTPRDTFVGDTWAIDPEAWHGWAVDGLARAEALAQQAGSAAMIAVHHGRAVLA